MPATTTIRVPGIPGELEFGDFVHDREWSTSQLAATQSTQIAILAAAQSETKPGSTTTLTAREATMPAGGQRGFPSGYEMYVYSIQLVFGSGSGVKYNSLVPAAGSPSDDEMLNLYTRCYFRLLIQSKLKSQGPLYKFNAGSGLWLTGTTTANASNRLYSNNGPPSPRDQSAYIMPHHLEPNVPFRGTLDFDAALALSQEIDIEGHLEGLLKRPVV